MPCQVQAIHDHEGVFHFGLPLAGWALALPLLRRAAVVALARRGGDGGRWLGAALALGTALMFVASHERWLKKNQRPREAATQRELMVEFDAIRHALGGREVVSCHAEPGAIDALAVDRLLKRDFWRYLTMGTVPWYPERLRDAAHWRRRGAPNRVLCSERVSVPSLRTPTHRHVFLYDSLDAVDAISEAWRREYERIAATTPLVARSAWDLRWDGRTLTYLKTPCADADLEGDFHLWTQGADAWTNEWFYLLRSLRRFDDRCAMRIPLTNPRRVRTTFHPHRNEHAALAWRAAFRLDHDALRAAGRAAFGAAWAEAQPSVENFRVRQRENALVYVRAPCDLADVEARFFLHATPAAAASPSARRRTGFDNLDFDFGEHGAVVDGACVAEVPLPDYPVTDIRTGQFAAGTEIWSARLAIAAQGRLTRR